LLYTRHDAPTIIELIPHAFLAHKLSGFITIMCSLR
jgi:hypothetical protein